VHTILQCECFDKRCLRKREEAKVERRHAAHDDKFRVIRMKFASVIKIRLLWIVKKSEKSMNQTWLPHFATPLMAIFLLLLLALGLLFRPPSKKESIPHPNGQMAMIC
jgi:hypothetical protein